jgi:hypothetical protein
MTLRAKNRILTLKTIARYQNTFETKQKQHRATFRKEDLILIKNKTKKIKKKEN